MKLKLILSLIFALIFNFAKSQNYTLGTTFNLGLSEIPLKLPIERLQSEFMPSGNVGFIMELKRKSSESSIGIGILWIQMQGSTTKTTLLDNGLANIGYEYFEIRTHISYIGLPIYYRFKLKRFGVRIGVQTLFASHTSSSQHTYREINNQSISYSFYYPKSQLNNFDLGPKIGIDFEILKRMRLKADYYLGLVDKKNRHSKVGNNSVQFTLGLFSFLEFDKK